VPGVLRREERVDAAAGADVERALDSGSRRQRVQHTSRGRVRRDVVGGILGVARKAVRGEQELGDRQDSSAGDNVLSYLCETGSAERLDSSLAKCLDGVARGDGKLEEDDPHNCGKPRLRQAAILDGRIVALG
jgi:hypothetical protein